MARREAPRRLIVNADDFGRSRAINQAVRRAHREGILTTASLMVVGEAFEEAVEMARENPRLGVGLHLTLVGGSAGRARSDTADERDTGGRFEASSIRAGWRHFFDPRCREPLRREVRAQFERFRQTGLPLDHVNGHHHFHLHPRVLGLLREEADELRIERVRLTRDPLWLNLRLASGRWTYRLSHALVFGALTAWAAPRFRGSGWRHTRHVFGLLQDGCVDRDYLRALLPRLPAGDAELYAHPSLRASTGEFEALVDPEIRRLVSDLSIQCIRYRDL